ncbi:MAG: hypothetical protein Q8919_15265, partial [Bacteroidota bacterium]|nr:hypothetical protein [Bacteroidota bacterium]
DIANVDTTYGFVLSHTYLNFESNGDLSVYVGGNGSSFAGVALPDWRTYPMQTHTTFGVKVADTTITFPGIPLPIPLKVFDSMFYVNSGVYTVGTASIPVFNMKESLTYDATILFSAITTSTARHISFSPSLGYIISDITDPTKSPIGAIPSFGGLEVTLISYKLK